MLASAFTDSRLKWEVGSLVTEESLDHPGVGPRVTTRFQAWTAPEQKGNKVSRVSMVGDAQVWPKQVVLLSLRLMVVSPCSIHAEDPVEMRCSLRRGSLPKVVLARVASVHRQGVMCTESQDLMSGSY